MERSLSTDKLVKMRRGVLSAPTRHTETLGRKKDGTNKKILLFGTCDNSKIEDGRRCRKGSGGAEWKQQPCWGGRWDFFLEGKDCRPKMNQEGANCDSLGEKEAEKRVVLK